jgi:murein DD-endopeptidase MepM/ murein hydrolase activator NlpD
MDYDEDGRTLKNFFLNGPIKFSRISSRFTKSRYHPVQAQVEKRIKALIMPRQEGSITTTAAGTVIRTGYTAGNGIM